MITDVHQFGLPTTLGEGLRMALIRRSMKPAVWLATALLGSLSACDNPTPQAVDAPVPVRISVEEIATLNDGAAPLLARPLAVDTRADGSVAIADDSDSDIKLYAADGSRKGTYGRRGAGPGEFQFITGAGVFRDSVWGYDFSSRRLTIFGPNGKPARVLPVPGSTWSVRALDDSLFLLVGAMNPAATEMLRIMRADGSLGPGFFDRRAYHGGNPDLVRMSAVIADGRDGKVFAGMVGSDSVFVFDYSGRPVAAGPIDHEEPLTTYRSLAASNNGRLRKSDGTSAVSGVEVVMGMLAMDDSRVALQLVRYDSRTGVDLLEGGRLVVLGPSPEGGLAHLGRSALAAGLLGRDPEGNGLLLGYGADGQDHHLLARLRLRDRSGGPGE